MDNFKIFFPAVFFLFNNEIISLIVLIFYMFIFLSFIIKNFPKN